MINPARLDPSSLASNATGKPKDAAAPADAMQFSAHLAEQSRRDVPRERLLHTADTSKSADRETRRAERRDDARAEREPSDKAVQPGNGKSKDTATADRASRADARSRATRNEADATREDAMPVETERAPAPETSQSADTAASDTQAPDKAAASPDGSLPDQVLALLAGLPPVNAATPAPATAVAAPATPGLLSALPGTAPLANAALDGASALAALATAPASADAAQSANPDDTLGAFAALLKDKNATDAGTGLRDALPDGRIALTAMGSTEALMPRTAVAAASAVATMAPMTLDEGFEDAFGARIGWMADQKLGEAELRVTPEHMGPIDVRLQLDGTRVTAQFQTHTAEVKQAIESSLGRLRDMLGQQGLQLANADVGQRQNGSGNSNGGPRAGFGAEAAAEGDAPRVVTMRRLRGLLDEYA